MKGHKIKSIGAIIIIAITVWPVMSVGSSTKYEPPPKQEIAKLLGWIPAPATSCSLCNGYFFQSKDILDHPTPAPYQSLPTRVTAKGPTIFSKTGESILQKEVQVTQVGRITKADKAYIFRNEHSGKISRIKLVGHVHLQEYGKLIVSKKANLNLENDTAQLHDVAYHLAQDHPRMGHNDGWGTAQKAARLSNGTLTFDHATYSTCSPLSPTWLLKASHIKIDEEKKRASAENMTLKMFGIPILYSPYFSFTIDQARKSGILAPIVEFSSKSGLTLGVPYYWNMAPNYDMSITPIYFAKRGFQLNTLFRYLTRRSEGNLYVSFAPKDDAFIKFKNDTIAEFPEPIDPSYQPFINEIKRKGDYRGYFAFNNSTKFNDRWTSDTEINYVTDPYYFRDFGATINEVVANQLRNQFDLKYEGIHWNFAFLTQAYQTLHQIDQYTTPTVDQYMRLPELDTSAEYPNMFGGLDFAINIQAVNFYYSSLFPPTTDTMPIGQRYHARPTLSRPITWAAGYLTPSVSIDNTTYNVEHRQPGQTASSSRTVPIADIDSGLYFSRRFSFNESQFTQTLEPRLFYLYVPYENQDRYPIYDTQILPFSFAQLFSDNRFTGFDRIQNANQVSFGLTSRILRADDASQILKASIGIGYFIDSPKICLTPNCFIIDDRWTPIATELSYYPTPHWSVTADFAWDPKLKQTNNMQANITYKSDGHHIIGAGYTFVHGQPNTPDYSFTSFSNNSSLYSLFFAWPLTDHWSTVGYLYYNVTEKRPENYFGGLQYDTCCITFRIIVDRTFLGTVPLSSGAQTRNQYSTNYIFQIQFKGIGSTGNDNPHAMLTSAIPGYRDPFKF